MSSFTFDASHFIFSLKFQLCEMLRRNALKNDLMLAVWRLFRPWKQRSSCPSSQRRYQARHSVGEWLAFSCSVSRKLSTFDGTPQGKCREGYGLHRRRRHGRCFGGLGVRRTLKHDQAIFSECSNSVCYLVFGNIKTQIYVPATATTRTAANSGVKLRF